MTAPRATWSETLVAFDGHLHDEAADCQHRPGDACRVCCVHDDDPRNTQPGPADGDVSSEWRDDVAASAKALMWTLLASAVGAALVIVAVLTKAGVIPS